MNNTVNILLLEDNLYDAELVHHQVLKSDLKFKWLHVIEWDEFVEAINSFKPDIILSDYNLGGFTGFDALEFAKENCPLIPFIIVTGTLNEETAADTIKKGAWDYVVKERLMRLSLAIKGVLEKKEIVAANVISENALRESEEFNRLIIESSKDCIKVLDLQGNLLSMSEGGQKLLEIDDLELYLNKSWVDFWKDDDHKAALESISKASKGGVGIFTGFCPTEKETPKWWEVIVSPIKDSQGKISRLLAVSRDITSRKLAEDKLHQSYSLNSFLLKTIPFGMDIVDESGTVLFQSDNFKELIGENGVGEKCWELYRDDHIQCSDCPLHKGINIGETDIYESHDILGGRVFEISHTGMMYEGKKAILEIFQDITERKKAEQIQKVLYNISNAVILNDNLNKLSATIQKELGTIIDTTNFYIALYDDKTDMFSLPHSVDEKEDIISFPPGKSFTNYVLKTKKPLLANKERVKEMINSEDVEMVGTPSKIWLGVPLKIKEEVIGVLAVQSYTDEFAYIEKDKEILEFISKQVSISIERKKAEEDLKSSLEKATESDRLKSAFLSNMSHEIRTPMNGILGFTELLQDANLSVENQRSYIDIIRKSSNRLLNTVNDIIEISKIESGQINFTKSEVNLIMHLNTFVLFFRPETEKKGIEIVVQNNIDGNYLSIVTDKTKLSSILSNLIKNAIKYTNVGTIKVGFKIENGQILFSCQDSGIGIPLNRQEAIFNRFEQADIDDKQAHQGSGLGLAIVKSYVEMLNGNIWVESEEGRGSTFYVSLPYDSKKKKEPNFSQKFEFSDSDMKDIKVLIVEDDEFSSMHLLETMQGITKNIRTAQNGIEAVDICKNDSSIDIILMDIKMPKMDGIEATKKIREFNKDVVIIAQTAFAFNEDKQNALTAGCTDYISKPIKKDKLLELISRYS